MSGINFPIAQRMRDAFARHEAPTAKYPVHVPFLKYGTSRNHQFWGTYFRQTWVEDGLLDRKWKGMSSHPHL